MPLYEYECEGCGEVFEKIQKFSDEPLTVHDKCGGHVHKLLSAPAFQFKGTGFYATDYAKGSNGGKRSDSEKRSESEKKSDSKSDSDKKTSADSSSKTESKSTESKSSGGEKSKSD